MVIKDGFVTAGSVWRMTGAQEVLLVHISGTLLPPLTDGGVETILGRLKLTLGPSHEYTSRTKCVLYRATRMNIWK